MMSGPGVGFEHPPQQVSWLKRDVLLFANSIGCRADELHFLFELHPEFSVFPTYPLVLTFKGSTQEVVDFYASSKASEIPGVPKLDHSRTVDGQRKIEFLKKLPTTAGRKFEARTKVLGVYDKGRPGTVLETQTDLVDAVTREVYTRVTSSAFFVGQGNWHGPKGPPTQNFAPPKDRKPDAILRQQTSPETALLYRLNGDYNPLHATPEPGRKMGFPGAITHEFQARFASPVMPGDTLEIRVWRMGKVGGNWEELCFLTQIEGGKVCLRNGRAMVRVVEGLHSQL